MKQKNLILLVVAVGCGLLAAFLTTQMSAKPAAVEMTEIIVAAKELPIGTKLEKDKLSDFIKRKKVPKADVPLDAVTTEEEVADKTVTQSRRADDVIALKDVGQIKELEPPPGKHLYVIKLPYEAVGPWVQPGRLVDTTCTHKPPGSQVVRQFPLLPELRVMAVDTQDKKDPTGGGRNIVNTVTLAASLEEIKWLQMAQDAGAQIRMIVRGPESESFTKLSDEDLYNMFNKLDPEKEMAKKPQVAQTPEEKGQPTTVRIPVTLKEVKAGTVIDDAFIEKAMQTQPFQAPAPTDAILDLNAYKGKIVLNDVAARQYLTEGLLADKPKPDKVEVTKVDPKPNDPVKSDPPKVETPKVEVKKPVEVWEPTITTGSGTKKVRYERYTKDGEWVFKGEVHDDGSVSAGPLPGLSPPKEKTSGGSNQP